MEGGGEGVNHGWRLHFLRIRPCILPVELPDSARLLGVGGGGALGQGGPTDRSSPGMLVGIKSRLRDNR